MKRFVYPLEPLRRYRSHLVERARAELTEAERRRQAVDSELEAIRASARQTLEAAAGGEAVDLLWRRRQTGTYLATLRRREMLQQSLLAKAVREQDQRLEALTRARQAEQQLDRHRERRQEAWAQDLRRWENLQTDEAAACGHVRQHPPPVSEESG